MNYLHSLGGGLAFLGNPVLDVILVAGTLLGVFVGAIPGLGGIVLMVVLLPFLYNKSPALALALLLGSHSAIYYAGSTTAILINTPGAPESAATCIDGYAMTRRGKTARALGISAAATTFGGWFGALAILAAVPLMLAMVNVFHPPEYFLLAILAIVVIGQLQAGSVTKGLLSGLLGFLLSFVGAAASTGTLRFTMGNLGVYNGINTATAAIGLFAISQMFILFGSNRRPSEVARFPLSREVWAEVREGIRDAFRWPWLLLRSAVLGVVCGVIPGIGSTAANFLSYGQARQTSKHPERFGTGTPEGVIAPEASSISKEAGALIPTVALGVPNGPAMAVVLAAFSIVGLAPGPDMLTRHLPLVFWMVVVLAVSSLLASGVGLGLAPVLARVTMLPGRLLVPFVLTLAAIGAYVSTTLLLQVALMIAFGVVGLLMRRYNYSLPAVIVGLVLGTTAENNLDLSVQLFSWRVVERPLSDVLLAVILAVIGLGFWHRSARRRQRTPSAASQDAVSQGTVSLDAASGDREAGRAGRRRAPVPARSPGEIAVDVIWVAGLALYVNAARRYPSPAEIGPVFLGLAALVVAVVQLIGGFFPQVRRITVGSPQDLTVTAAAAQSAAPDSAAAEGAAPDGAVTDAPLPEEAAALGTGGALRYAATADAPAHLPAGRGDGETAAGPVPPGAGSPVPPAAGPIGAGEAGSGPQAAGRDGAGERGAWNRWKGIARREAVGQALCAAMGALLVAGIYLFGYQIAVPVFVFAYLAFVYRWRWWKTGIATAVMIGAVLLASLALGIQFPTAPL